MEDQEKNRFHPMRATIQMATEFRCCLKHYLGYEILYKLIALILMTPVLILILTGLIATTGHPAITNMELLSFLISLPGLLAVLVTGTVIAAVLIAEEAGLVIIAVHGRSLKRIMSRRALGLMAKKIPALMGTGLAAFLILLAWTAPALAAGGGIYYLLQSTHDINYYFQAKPPEFILALVVAGLLLAGCTVVWMRYFVIWMFIVPVSLFENKTFFKALKRSAELAQGAFWRILGIMVGWSAAVALISGAIMALGSVPTGLLLLGAQNHLTMNVAMLAVLGAINAGIGTLISLLAAPWFGLLITRLYLEAYQRKGWSVPESALCGEALPLETEAKRKNVRTVTVLLVSVVFVVIAAAIGVYLFQAVHKTDQVHVIAHRGDSIHAPENTLSALRKAIELKAEIAEIDVQETQDGVIMVMHDNDLMRVARVNKGLWQMTYDEARQLDIGSWFSPEFKGEKIPTLEEVIDLTRGKIKMIIELKYNGHDRFLPERTVEIIKKKGFENQCVISSLNYEGLQKVKQLDDRLQTIYILFGEMGNVAKLKADGFGLQAAQVTPDFVQSIHERGKLVYVWTVDDPKEMEDFAEMDVDYIYTNDPAELIRLLKQRAAITPAEKLKIKFQRLLDSISADTGL